MIDPAGPCLDIFLCRSSAPCILHAQRLIICIFAQHDVYSPASGAYPQTHTHALSSPHSSFSRFTPPTHSNTPASDTGESQFLTLSISRLPLCYPFTSLLDAFGDITLGSRDFCSPIDLAVHLGRLNLVVFHFCHCHHVLVQFWHSFHASYPGGWHSSHISCPLP